MFHAPLLVRIQLVLVLYSMSPAVACLTPNWNALNASVGGRLHATIPFELPCFSTFGGESVVPDPAACAMTQENYTDPVFRVARFGAYMIASIVFLPPDSRNL